MLRLRITWLLLIALLVVGSGPTPLRAANPTGQLSEAHKLMQNGAYVRAIEVIDASLSAGNMPADMNGRALLMRAQCNEKLGKSAFALADYNQALWMEGLPAADKKAAEEGRKRVEGGLGLKSSSEGDVSANASVATPAPAKAAPKAPAKPVVAAAQPTQTPPPQQQAPKEEGGIGGFFNSIFGGGSQKEEAQPHRAVVAEVKPEQPRAASKPVKAVTASTTNTAASPVRPVKVATNAAPPPAATPAATAGSGEYAIQFAALLAEDLAIAEVNRIAKKFGADLGGRSPSVVIAPTKDGGTLYKIVAGPYPKAEGVATCEILKAKNVNCMVISHKQP